MNKLTMNVFFSKIKAWKNNLFISRDTNLTESNHYLTDKMSTCLKQLSSLTCGKICHVHYEEQDLERSFFMVEAFSSAWSTYYHLGMG